MEKLPPITEANVKSVGRHVVTFTAGAGLAAASIMTYLQTMHVGHISIDDIQTAEGAFKALGDGLTSVFGALATFAAFASGTWAFFSSRPQQQAASLLKTVPGTAIVAPPALADKVDAVQSTTEAKVVGK